jgi:hypothetical protein
MFVKEVDLDSFKKFVETLHRLGILVDIKCTILPFLYQDNYMKVYQITSRRNDES